jgi:hypothetical protein
MTMCEWRSELLVQRIRDPSDAEFKLSMDAGAGCCDTTSAEELRDLAIRHLEADDLTAAERLCQRTETELLNERQRCDC